MRSIACKSINTSRPCPLLHVWPLAAFRSLPAGGWGKPPVDADGNPLYGDVFGEHGDGGESDEEVRGGGRLACGHWGAGRGLVLRGGVVLLCPGQGAG